MSVMETVKLVTIIGGVSLSAIYVYSVMGDSIIRCVFLTVIHLV